MQGPARCRTGRKLLNKARPLSHNRGRPPTLPGPGNEGGATSMRPMATMRMAMSMRLWHRRGPRVPHVGGSSSTVHSLLVRPLRSLYAPPQSFSQGREPNAHGDALTSEMSRPWSRVEHVPRAQQPAKANSHPTATYREAPTVRADGGLGQRPTTRWTLAVGPTWNIQGSRGPPAAPRQQTGSGRRGSRQGADTRQQTRSRQGADTRLQAGMEVTIS